MEWNYNIPKNGDTRIVKRFLIFPRYINGKAKWWCNIKILQQYEGHNYADTGWSDVEFVNK